MRSEVQISHRLSPQRLPAGKKRVLLATGSGHVEVLLGDPSQCSVWRILTRQRGVCTRGGRGGKIREKDQVNPRAASKCRALMVDAPV